MGPLRAVVSHATGNGLKVREQLDPSPTQSTRRSHVAVHPTPTWVRATGAARARLVAVSVPDLIPGRDVPADVRPDEWTAYIDALHASLRNLAEQTDGTAVFSREELDAEFTRLAQP